MRREKQNTGERGGGQPKCMTYHKNIPRYVGGTSEEFCRVYRNSLARDGGKEKERVQQNIKAFLRQRKKHQRDMNDFGDV